MYITLNYHFKMLLSCDGYLFTIEKYIEDKERGREREREGESLNPPSASSSGFKGEKASI